jgi:hypothetical protein
VTCLQDELLDELRAEYLGGGDKNEYAHLADTDLNDDFDADDLAYLELPTGEEAAKAVADQRALKESFETQHHDESTHRLMTAERRAAADRLAAAQQRARRSAHRRNMAATREMREAAERHREEEERARAAALARVREHQYPSPPRPTLAS